MVKNFEEMVETIQNGEIYQLIIHFPNKNDNLPLFETNLTSVVALFEAYLESKANDYIEVEKQVGNFGFLALQSHISILFNLVLNILSYKYINGIYFKSLARNVEFNENQQTYDEIKDELVVDTRNELTFPVDEYYYFINLTLSALFDVILPKYDDEEYIKMAYELVIPDEMVVYLSEFYNGKLTPHEFKNVLNNKTKEMKKSHTYN